MDLNYEDRKPSKDAHLVKLLRDEGAVIMGKCVTTEFALSGPGKTKNPKDLECTPGGSSSVLLLPFQTIWYR